MPPARVSAPETAAVWSGPLLYAHRGAAIEQPENTLQAFRRAIELGADVLETDAHMTLDGHVVISHDATGERMCGVRWPICKARLDEVMTWDAGFGFVDAHGKRPFAGKGYRLPTLEELLVELPGVRVQVDAKQARPSMVPALLKLLRRLRAQPHVRIASFSSATLEDVRRRGYEGQTGLGRTDVARAALLPMTALARAPVRGHAAQLPTHAGPIRFDTPSMIARFHAQGLRVDFWTINDPREGRRLLDAGADGIMTDDPGALAALFAGRRAPKRVRSPAGEEDS